MKNIGFIHEEFPCGGAEKVTSHIAASLSKKGYRFFVFTCNLVEDKLSDEERRNLNFIKISPSDLFEETPNSVWVKKAKGIDIMVFTGSNFNVKRESIVRSIGCKYIFSNHGTPFWEIDDIEVEFERRISDKNFFSKIKHRIKHRIKLKKANIYFKNLYKNIYQSCDAFTVLCDDYQREISERIGVGTDKFYVIPNGVPHPKITYSLNKKRQLLYVGRMSYADKRVDRLIDIWKNIYKKFPDWEFVLVGDGAERISLEEKVKAYSLERILFCGAVKNVEKYYDQAAILCLSSQFESWGLVLTEAQQAGVVPIAFNCSKGVESILSPSWENGVLIENFDMKAYQEALVKLMTDENLRHSIQKNIIEKSCSYNMDKIGEKWDNLFQKLLNKV